LQQTNVPTIIQQSDFLLVRSQLNAKPSSAQREDVIDSKTTVRAGGWALIFGALAFMGVFGFLAARFNYPAVLDGSAHEVFPQLLATGRVGRAAWAIYALLPLIWLPAGVGAYCALRRFAPGAMLLALLFAGMASISMMLGLMRWPSIHWRLAEAYATADPDQRVVLAALFDGLNSYLGNYLGEFLGELSFSAFFLLSAWSMRKSPTAPRWAAPMGLITGVAGLIGLFRNMTSAVDVIASINNYLLPVWMIGFGIVLLRYARLQESMSA
jgi:uncharacterized protein DUF4386